MSQNYNINMRKFNGTDYDGLLPLAYNALNSQQLDGKTFNEIQNLFESNYVKLYSRSYIGTGADGWENPTTITFPFQPSIIILPRQTLSSYNRQNTSLIYISSELPTDFYLGSGVNDAFYIKKSSDGKSITWYATAYTSSDAPAYQFNIKDVRYYFAGIGGFDQGGQTEWILTASQTWTVPRTGKYYIELYGRGGGCGSLQNPNSSSLSAGSSCQSYDSVVLTQNQQINVTIGKRRTTKTYGEGTEGEKTVFGSYQVNGGGRSKAYTVRYGNTGENKVDLGLGAGNKRKKGVDGGYTLNTNNGILGTKYGCGGYLAADTSPATQKAAKGTSRAVYLKYLGA